MIIKRLDFEEHVFQFKHGDYVMSYVTQHELSVRVLCLETDDGHRGWGEIVRKPTVNVADVTDAEASALAALVGRDVGELPVYVRQLSYGDKRYRGLAFGLDTAYWDWIARRAELPLYSLFGARVTDDLPEYYSLSGDDSIDVGRTLQAEAMDWSVIQVKLGVGDLASDCERVQAALDVLSNEQTILADFNGALGVDDALNIIARFDDRRLVWEEPCNTVNKNTQVARQSQRPIMFDQCLENLSAFNRVVADGVAHSVCLKPAFLGGLSVALAAREVCIAGGMKVRLDGPWCGHIATAVGLHLAVGVPSDLLIAGCDLRQPLALNDDWGGTQHLANHRIAPCETSGHGVVPP